MATRIRTNSRIKQSGTSSKSGSLGRVDQAAKRQQERKDAAGRKWLKWDGDGSHVVRVLDVDDDFKDAIVHRVPFERENGKTYHLDIPCLDQDEDGTPCPGCADDLDKRYKFFTNVIARDYVDPDEKGAKAKDQLVILSGGIMLAKQLAKKHKRFGLQNRDIEIEREGEGRDTTYSVEWAEDRNTPLSSADKKLAEKRFDLKRYYEPPAEDDFYKSPKERSKDDGDSGNYGDATKRSSPFRGERKSGGSATRSSSKSNNDKPKSGLAALRAQKEAAARKPAVRKTIVRRSAR